MSKNYEQFKMDDDTPKFNYIRKPNSFGEISKNKNSLVKLLISVGAILLLIILVSMTRSCGRNLKEEKSKNIDLNYKSTQAKTANHDLEMKYNDFKNQKNNLNKEKDEINKSIENLKGENEKLQTKIDEIKPKVTEVKDKIEKVQDSINEVTEEKDKIEKEVNDKKKELKTLNEEIKEYEEKIKEKENEKPKIPNLDSMYALNEEQVKMLVEWIDEKGDFTFKKIYECPEDTLSNAEFHKRCDDKGPTLILFKINGGVIIGGYTTEKWDGDGFKGDPDAFVFNLNLGKKYKIFDLDNAIYSQTNSEYIIIFGQGDIIISERETKSDFPRSYGKDENELELTGGKRSFDLFSLEVYEIIPN